MVKSAVCFRKNDVQINLYVSRQASLRGWLRHLPESSAICEFCNVKYTSDQVSHVICFIMSRGLSKSLIYTTGEKIDMVCALL